MKLKEFRLGWRLLLQNPGYSAIMILGLAIGFMAAFLTLAYTHYEFSFDKNVPNIGQVYVLKARHNWGMSSWSENVSPTLKDTLAGAGLPIKVTGVLPYPATVLVDNVAHNVEITIVDPAFPEVFGLGATEGSLQDVLARPDAVALSAKSAQTLFGNGSAIGKQFDVHGQRYRVGAVLPQQPITSSLQFQILAGPNSTLWSTVQRKRATEIWRFHGDDDVETNKVYLRVPPGTDLKDLVQRLETSVASSALRGHLNATNIEELGDKKLLDIDFGPLANSYLDAEARNNSGSKGDMTTIYLLNAVALLLLVLTAGNYVNLATIRTIQRQREMAMRKVLGMSPGRLVGQMMAESIVVAMFAALIGALLAWGLLGPWSDLTEHDMVKIMTAGDWTAFVVIALAMGLLVGVCGGLYPAWIALKMRPSQALGGRGNSETAGGFWLRRVLTVLQFMIGIFVTGMVITIGWQIKHLKNIDYGYQLDSLITIIVPEELSATQVRSFQDALMRQPGIKGVAGINQWPVEHAYQTLGAEKAELLTLGVSPEYFATIGLPVEAGRAFDPKIDAIDDAGVIVIDSLAAQRLGYPTAAAAVGQYVNANGKQLRVVGISKQVSRGFMRGGPKPIVYEIAARTPQLTINGGSDLAAAQAATETLWRQYFPEYYLQLNNARAMLERNAGGPQAMLDTARIVAVITIPLAIFSIYILSSYAVQRRSREIVMRKLYGAGPSDIARLLSREFLLLTGIAALVSVPLVYLLGSMFVQQFHAQAPVGIWAALVSLVGAVVVTILATARHMLIATRMSPAVALRAA